MNHQADITRTLLHSYFLRWCWMRVAEISLEIQLWRNRENCLITPPRKAMIRRNILDLKSSSPSTRPKNQNHIEVVDLMDDPQSSREEVHETGSRCSFPCVAYVVCLSLVDSFLTRDWKKSSPDSGPFPSDGVPRWLDGPARPADGPVEKHHRHQGTSAGTQDPQN